MNECLFEQASRNVDMTMMTRCMGAPVSTTPPRDAPNKDSAGGNGAGVGGGGGGVQVTRPMLKGMGVSAKVIDKIMRPSGKKKEKRYPERKKGGNPDSKLSCKDPKCGKNTLCNKSHKDKEKAPIGDRLGEVVAP